MAFVVGFDEEFGEFVVRVGGCEADTADVDGVAEALFDEGEVGFEACAFEIGVIGVPADADVVGIGAGIHDDFDVG